MRKLALLSSRNNVNIWTYFRSSNTEVAFNLSSSSRFLDVFFTIFIFEKNCPQIYLLPKRLVMSCMLSEHRSLITR
jgi:hypothetical protein